MNACKTMLSNCYWELMKAVTLQEEVRDWNLFNIVQEMQEKLPEKSTQQTVLLASV